MTQFVNNIQCLEYKAPKDLPDTNSRYMNSAEQTNVCITQQLRNAMTLSGVELPNTVIRSDAIDPLFLAKTIQHYASFAQNYIVDPSSTANNIIITPSTQNIQLQTVSLESNGSEIVVNTNNINGLVDAQVFDKLPNGAIFQFIPSLSSTSSAVNLTVRIKRLKWDVGTLSQIVETKDFSYPIKNIDGITSLNSGDIVGQKLIIVHFDSSSNVFKIVNKQIPQASETVAGIIKTATAALVNGGTDNTTALTPLQLKTFLASVTGNSKTANGWTYLSNGIILQWGLQNESIVGTFPITFPNACFGIQACINLNAFDSNSAVTTAFVLSTSQFRVRCGIDNNNLLYWFSYGC